MIALTTVPRYAVAGRGFVLHPSDGRKAGWVFTPDGTGRATLVMDDNATRDDARAVLEYLGYAGLPS